MDKTFTELLLELHKKQQPSYLRKCKKLYLSSVDSDIKGFVLQEFKRNHCELHSAIGQLRKECAGPGAKAAVTAARLFYFIFGRAPICKECRLQKMELLKKATPVDFRHCCSKECRTKYVKRAREATMMERYGYRNIFHSKEWQLKKYDLIEAKHGKGIRGPLSVPGAVDKKRNTSRLRYGADSWAASDTGRSYKKESQFRKHGTWFICSEEGKRKIREGSLRNHNGEHHSKDRSVKLKKIETSLKNLGTEHPMQHPDVKRKLQEALVRENSKEIRATAGKKRLYKAGRHKLGSWRDITIKYQGAELKVLKRIEKDSTVLDYFKPEHIEYRDGLKERIYFPDFGIRRKDGLHWIVEVKSMYTILLDFENNKRKFKAAARKGLKFVLAIDLGRQTLWVTNPHRRLKSRIKSAHKEYRQCLTKRELPHNRVV